MSSHQDYNYLDLLSEIVHNPDFAEERTDRTGVGTYGLFGWQMHFPLDRTFPLLTSKRVHWKSVVHELLWIMSGSTNIKYLQDNGVTIWEEWADENGDLGPVYGSQWRYWTAPSKATIVPGKDEIVFGTIDQLRNVIESLKNDPASRRHIITAWNPNDVPSMALPPCHAFVQFWVSQKDNSLHCQLYQRSADVFLGLPFNIASYALLTCILADTLGFARGSFVWSGGDVHLYKNHLEQAKEQLSRWGTIPRSPTLKKIDGNDPLAVKFEDIVLEDYNPLPGIKAPVAV